MLAGVAAYTVTALEPGLPWVVKIEVGNFDEKYREEILYEKGILMSQAAGEAGVKI